MTSSPPVLVSISLLLQTPVCPQKAHLLSSRSFPSYSCQRSLTTFFSNLFSMSLKSFHLAVPRFVFNENMPFTLEGPPLHTLLSKPNSCLICTSPFSDAKTVDPSPEILYSYSIFTTSCLHIQWTSSTNRCTTFLRRIFPLQPVYHQCGYEVWLLHRVPGIQLYTCIHQAFLHGMNIP